MQKILIGVVVVLATVGAWWFFGDRVSAPTTTALTASDVSWKYTNAGEDAAKAPQTKVSVTIAGKTQDAGTYQGTCSPVATLADNEISGVLCWYAGGGKEIGVFKEGSTYVVKVGDQDEGSAEEAGFRGNFKTVLTIE